MSDLRDEIYSTVWHAVGNWDCGSGTTISERISAAIFPLVESALAAARSEALNEAAQAIEADPGAHYVRTKQYCMPYSAEDLAELAAEGEEIPYGCGVDHPCPGHDDGFSTLHGRDHYVALVRSLSQLSPEEPQNG